MNNNIIKKIYRSKDIGKIQNKINKLGDNRKIKFDAVMFLNVRIISSILIVLFLVFLTNIQFYIIPFILIIYYYLVYYLLILKQVDKRAKKLDKEALTFFEILTLTLESGKNLENSLEITCYNVDSELSKEFRKCLLEMRFGRSLMESLDNLKSRIPSDNINNIILNIQETNMFGNNIVDVMNNQVDYLRDKQLMEVKSQINKIPNKVSIISVIFIVPLILLIVLGPFILNLFG